MSTHATVYNPTLLPVQVDDDGRVIGAGEWASVRRRTDVVRRAIDSGSLVVVDKPGGDLDPEAAAAFAATDEANSAKDESSSKSQAAKPQTPKEA